MKTKMKTKMKTPMTTQDKIKLIEEETKEIKLYYEIKNDLIDLAYDQTSTRQEIRENLEALYCKLAKFRNDYINPKI